MMKQFLLNHVDGRDSTPQEKWPDLLFWGKFVGSDISHRMVPVNMPDGRQVYRCGWTHYAPNSERDYDWANARRVETDIEDWQPEGIGRTRTNVSGALAHLQTTKYLPQPSIPVDRQTAGNEITLCGQAHG